MSIDINSQEVKDAIAAAVEEATGGLRTKNAELLGKLKKAQQGASVDPADFDALERERDQLRADLAAANKAVKKATTDLEAASKRAGDAEAYTTKLLVENGLNEALASSGVTNPVHQKAAKAMLASQVQVVADGDARSLKVGDKGLSDYMKEWAAGDEGKHFVTAAASNGGGASNNGRPVNPAAKTIARSAFNALSPAEQMAHAKAGGLITD